MDAIISNCFFLLLALASSHLNSVDSLPTTMGTTIAPGTNCTELTDVSGTFTSPNYPSNYPNNLNVCWLITGGDYINLAFNTFETEAYVDVVKIYKGRTTLGLWALYSGPNIPSNISMYTDALLIIFVSDSTNNFKGFNASYEFQPLTTTTVNFSTTAITTGYSEIWSNAPTCSSCSGSYGGDSGAMSSPNYPQNYCNDLDCRYSITVPSSYKIRLYFTTFNTESNWDYVRVYDGPTIYNTTLLNYAGSSLPNDIYSSGNQMLVRFTTDSSTAQSGWQANYEVFP